MKKIVMLIISLIVAIACQDEGQPQNNRGYMFVTVDCPFADDKTIFGLMVKKNVFDESYLFSVELRQNIDNVTIKKYIDLGKEVYKNHFYDVFDPKIYTTEDSLYIDNILINDPNQYYYLGYIYNREHLHTCSDESIKLDESPMMINNQ